MRMADINLLLIKSLDFDMAVDEIGETKSQSECIVFMISLRRFYVVDQLAFQRTNGVGHIPCSL